MKVIGRECATSDTCYPLKCKVCLGKKQIKDFENVALESGLQKLKAYRSELIPSQYFNTYLLTALSRVLLEKLTGSAASQEIPAFYGTRRFISVFTSARHLSLS